MIPVNRPIIKKSDVNKVFKVIKKGWISSSGPEVKIFEKKFSKLIGKKYGSLVTSGTAALEIAIKSLDFKKNDEIIIPNFTIISNALAVFKNNLKIVPIDCNVENWNMDIELLKKKINSKTKAIIATHIYGYPLEMDKIKSICKKNKIYLIEDAAEMLGNKFKNKYCGSFGDISIFSFYANKTITMGEGGILITNSKKLKKKFDSLKNLCFGSIDRYNHDDIGWNYRITNMQATLGLSQLSRIKFIVNKKKEIGKIYYNLLSKNKNIFIQKPKLGIFDNAYWVVGIVIKNNFTTSKILRKKLQKKKIDSRAFFWPINKQKVFEKLKIKFNGDFSNSEFLNKFGLYLPSGVGTTKKEIFYVCKVLNELLS